MTSSGATANGEEFEASEEGDENVSLMNLFLSFGVYGRSLSYDSSLLDRAGPLAVIPGEQPPVPTFPFLHA